MVPRPDPLETSLLFDVFALNQTLGVVLTEALRAGPLTPSEYAVYSAIFELEAASPTALAARLGMRLTTLVDQLRVVESRGHLRRVPNPADRRSHRVVLTADGLAAHRSAAILFEGAAQRFEAALGEAGAAARMAVRAMRAAAAASATAAAASAVSAAASAVASSEVEPVSPRRRADPGG